MSKHHSDNDHTTQTCHPKNEYFCYHDDCHHGQGDMVDGEKYNHIDKNNTSSTHPHQYMHHDTHFGEESCSCHDDGCGCGHAHGAEFEKKSLLFIGISTVLFAASFIIKNEMALAATLLFACLIPGYEIFMDGFRNLSRLKFDENTLMVIAVMVAFILGEYREAAAVTILFSIGEYFEGLAIAKSKREIEALSSIRSETATILDGIAFKIVSANSVPVGSIILIKPGERIPLDAVVIEGTSLLDTSALTGESQPVSVSSGSPVLSAAINLTSVIKCRTTAGYDDSTASKIINLVADAASTKGKTETLISRFAKVYTPIVMGLAAMLAFLPPLFGFGELSTWVSRSLIFLVASCPCALVISIPLSFFAGVGACSKAGVLIKGTKYLELLNRAKIYIFDKTGTLTTGKMSVSGVYGIRGHREEEVLTAALSCCSNSNHPMSKAVCEYANCTSPISVEHFFEIAGKGLSAEINGKTILVGSHKLMEAHQLDLSGLPSANLYVADNFELLGYILVEDIPRKDAEQIIRFLKDSGRKTVMLTGDHLTAAKKAQVQIGIDEIHASLLPQDKLLKLQELCKQGTTIFVGDGINDAPVLAGADVGIAMGLGSDAAIEAADVVLLSDKLSSLIPAIKLSKRTLSVAKFNMAFALGTKAIVLILGAMGIAQMWTAVFADVGVSVLTVLNATRLLKVKS